MIWLDQTFTSEIRKQENDGYLRFDVKQKLKKELREEMLQKFADEKEEQEILASASPELVYAIANIKPQEAQLAEKEWENKRLTALVSELGLKLRDATKIK